MSISNLIAYFNIIFKKSGVLVLGCDKLSAHNHVTCTWYVSSETGQNSTCIHGIHVLKVNFLFYQEIHKPCDEGWKETSGTGFGWGGSIIMFRNPNRIWCPLRKVGVRISKCHVSWMPVTLHDK